MPYLIISWSIEPRYIYNDLVKVSDPLPTTAEIWRITFCLWCNHARIYGEWDNGRVHVACVFCHYSAFAFVSDFGAEYHITFSAEYYITFGEDSPMECDAYVSSHD